MSKFNNTTTAGRKPDSVNMAGGVSYSRDNIKQEIATVVLNSMINGDSYYEKETDRLARVEALISNSDVSEFVAKAMIYTRNEGNLRSISHYMAGILAENVKGSSYLRSAITKTLVRPDDMTEILSLWNSRNKGKMLPNSVRRAFKDALETKFDAYQMKKYAGERSEVKLRDVVKLTHPSPKRFEDQEIFKKVIEGTLENIATAQTVNAGSTGEARAQNYKVMLANRKLGYMAALKNMKNIIEAGADSETINMLCSLLRNEKACLNSRVLPFRFTQAYSMVEKIDMDRIDNKKLLQAIEDGFIISARNVPIVEQGERVALLLDESGSMGGFYGSESDMTSTQPFMIGKTLMASMLCGLDKANTVGYLWADRAREISVDEKPMSFIKNTNTQGGGTDVWAAIKGLIDSKTVVDKLVIFTDMQMYDIGRGWGSNRKEFKDMVKEYRKINPKVKVLFWNLQGYNGGTPMKLDHDILEVAGFSDKMLDVVAKMFKYSDKDALVKEIEAVKL
jgi:60 kDa SS-A/Ro ribonucleoprotein